MKKVLILFLLSFLINGCMSYLNVFERGETQNLPERDYPIRIHLVDGSIIDVEPNEHIFLSQPSDIVLYQIEVRDSIYDRSSKIKLWYLSETLESIKTSKDEIIKSIIGDDHEYYSFIRDTLLHEVYFAKGLWISGELKKDGTESHFTGELNLNEVEKIDKYAVDPLKVTGATLMTGVILGLIIFLHELKESKLELFGSN